MLVKHFILCLLLNISLNFCGLMSRKSLAPSNGQKLLESVIKLTDTLIEVTPYLNSTLAAIPPNCVQMLCKFVCFNGISTDTEKDILMVSRKNNYFCSRIDELQLYNYAFPDEKLNYGFLGKYSDKVEKLYLASANITDIDAGAFAKGKFKEIYLENLQLKELRKDFFKGISHDFNTLTIIQKQKPIQRAGLKSVGNLTGGDFLLNNLAFLDFSHNDFGSRMEYTTFSKVSMLERLDLSYSNLEFLPPYIFADFITTLEHLDLSHNRLITISRNIFGWREIPRDFKIYAEDNKWSCSCDLQKEIRATILHYRTPLVCSEPDAYKGLTVFDDQICGRNLESHGQSQEVQTESFEEDSQIIPTILNQDNGPYILEHTTAMQLNEMDKNSNSTKPGHLLLPNFIKLNCLTSRLSRNQSTAFKVRSPLIVFSLNLQKNLHAEVVMNSTEEPYDTFSLIWFNKLTSKFYKMEINYNEYGLGCHKNILRVTTAKNLLPNTAYTFCLVSKQQLTVSPFNCKSMHVNSNLAVQNSAWLNRDMRVAGLALVLVGIVMFLFAGIFVVYLLLKRKPILLKGSKRVTTLNSSTEEIVVLPKKKSIRSIKEKEEKLARYGPFTISQKRRKSNVSEASYESYINTNVYEVIPAFEEPNTKNSIVSTNSSLLQTMSAETKNPETENCYLTPLDSMPDTKHVQYAKIPYRLKRNSHDVLPQLPADVPAICSFLRESQDMPDYAQIGNIYFLDSQV